MTKTESPVLDFAHTRDTIQGTKNKSHLENITETGGMRTSYGLRASAASERGHVASQVILIAKIRRPILGPTPQSENGMSHC